MTEVGLCGRGRHNAPDAALVAKGSWQASAIHTVIHKVAPALMQLTALTWENAQTCGYQIASDVLESPGRT